MNDASEKTVPVKIRPLRQADNQELAELIRTVFREFKIDRPGTVYTDPTTDDLFGLFKHRDAEYWVAEEDGAMLGGCGIYPTSGLPPGCAELVKLYVKADARGRGIGRLLMEKCFESAKSLGYIQLYLETLPELDKAVGMYEKAGFVRLPERLGNSGHYSCNIWMLKKL
jgi:putative acetyltransferase